MTVRLFVFPTDEGGTEEKILEALYRVTGEEKILRRDENGKPFVTDGSAFVSVSHTEKLTFVAVAEKNIGLDAEKLSRPTDPRLTRWFSLKEKAAAGERNAGRLKMWVRKEAYGKFTGRGLGELAQDTFTLPGRFFYLCHAGHILTLYSEERVERVIVAAGETLKRIDTQRIK